MICFPFNFIEIYSSFFPEYKHYSNSSDIALLKLEQGAKYGPLVGEICLPPKSDKDYVGYHATVAGWGKVGYNKSASNVMLEATIPIISNQECQKLYEIANIDYKIQR